MANKFLFLFLTVVFLHAFTGCTSWEEPLMLQKESAEKIELSAKNRENKERSNAYGQTAAQSGWYNFSCYQRYNDIYYLKSAGRSFNYCYSFDPQNYNAYWGWGIVMGERATTDGENKAEFFLIQSIELFKLAIEKNIPPKERNNFYLDWSNAYNGLGAFYAQKKEYEKSIPPLNKAQELLLEVLKQEPQNGRAYFHLSVTYFYRNDFIMARQYADKAIEHKFDLPKDYADDLQKQYSK